MLLKLWYLVSTYMAVANSPAPPKLCGINEEWSEETTICTESCEFQNPPCYTGSNDITPGCQCKTNYIRLNEVEPICVRVSDCPKNCTKPHSKWNDCGTLCPPTCEIPNPEYCIDICIRGCFCEDNYVLNTAKMECIKLTYCL
ncbi:hypothetical protein WA026_017933 [Henosepilachna vigintioctopunctata]|uniref:TIL domain-containing protein n=1 Tax=Henosepilachna vigintioctopunctata TaxID=420089 RepID=A0AAW1TNV5_9CUCU